MRPRAILLTFLLLSATVALGLAVRFGRMGLPPFVVKYGGSAAWAAMIYWAVSAVLPRLDMVRVTLISGGIATAVEFFKLYHSPGMDAVRLTLPGILLLGRHFSLWDILAYWIAICAAALLDRSLRRGSAERLGTH